MFRFVYVFTAEPCIIIEKIMPRRTVDAAQPRKSVDAVISRRSESVKPLSESVDAAQPHQSTQRTIIKYIRRGYI